MRRKETSTILIKFVLCIVTISIWIYNTKHFVNCSDRLITLKIMIISPIWMSSFLSFTEHTYVPMCCHVVIKEYIQTYVDFFVHSKLCLHGEAMTKQNAVHQTYYLSVLYNVQVLYSYPLKKVQSYQYVYCSSDFQLPITALFK